MTARSLDLGVADVHVEGPIQVSRGRRKPGGKRVKPVYPAGAAMSMLDIPMCLADPRTKKKPAKIAKVVEVSGIQVAIDRPKGFVQELLDDAGNVVATRTYLVDYGFIRKTDGGDGEELDVFVGPNPRAERAYLIKQLKKDGTFDELKVMLGFDSDVDALACYCAHIPQERFGDMIDIPVGFIRALLGIDPGIVSMSDHGEWSGGPTLPPESVGYFTGPNSDPTEPTNNTCPLCGVPWTETDVRTVSLMAIEGPACGYSLFYRMHRTCAERAPERAILDLDQQAMAHAANGRLIGQGPSSSMSWRCSIKSVAEGVTTVGLSGSSVMQAVLDAYDHYLAASQARRLADGRYDHIDFSVPKGVAEEAKRGLDWRKEHGRGGTEVGVATARALVGSPRVSPDKARHISRYFPRHEVDKKGKGWSPAEDGFPSNGRIAWALWGGDPGRAWSEKLVRQMDAADEKKASDRGEPAHVMHARESSSSFVAVHGWAVLCRAGGMPENHPALSAELSGTYANPDDVGGWLGWIEAPQKDWIAFVAKDGRSLFWPARDIATLSRSPTSFDRPDLATTRVTMSNTEADLNNAVQRSLATLGLNALPTDKQNNQGQGKRTMAPLKTKQRKALPKNAFAWPEQRAYPIHDAAHARNAMARLEQNKSSMSKATYDRVKGNILKAYKKFGIKHEGKPVEAKEGAMGAPFEGRPMGPRPRGLHMRIGLPGGPSFEIRHAMADGEDPILMGECVELTLGTAKAPACDQTKLNEQVKALRDKGLVEEAERLLASAKGMAASDGETDDGPRWIQVAKVGTFRGHPAGPFDLNPGIFEQIVDNFRKTVNQRIPIDFEHATEEPCANGSIPVLGAPAQGWILELDNRGADGLWGLVRWMEPARTYIREGKYRFFSPAIRFGSKDRVTGQPIGARMTSGALTNNPFLDGMLPVAAKDRPGGSMLNQRLANMNTFFPALRSALRLGESATAAECKAEVGRLREHAENADPNMVALGFDLKPYMTDLRALMNVPAHMTFGDLLDAIEEMIDEAIIDHEDEYHANSSDNNGATTTMTNNVNMTDTDPAALVALNDKLNAEVKRLGDDKAAMGVRLKDAEDRNAMLELQLKDARVAADNAKAENAKLAEQIRLRDESDLARKVDTAFLTYKDVKRLTDEDKRGMLVIAKNDPEQFDKMYPLVPANQADLLRRYTESRSGVQGGANGANGTVPMRQPVDAPNGFGATHNVDVVALSNRLEKEKGLSLRDASNAAYKIARGTATMADYGLN